MDIPTQSKTGVSSHFGAIFHYATMGIIITDESGKIVSMNPYALSEFGYTEDELNGQPIETLIPGRFHTQHKKHLKNYLEKPQTRLMGSLPGLLARKKDGTEFPVEISLNNYQRGRHHFTMAFIVDISARKNAEAEIVKLNTELEAKVKERTADLEFTTRQLELSKNRLEEALRYQRNLFYNAGVMILATDKNGIINYFNPEYVACTGYEAAEIVGQQTPMLLHDRTELNERRKELFEKFGVNVKEDFDVLVEKSRRNIHTEEQFTLVRKDLTRFPVLLSITAIRDNAGEITGFMGIAVDISERKKTEEALLESLKKERELSELNSRFVSMASHEFRTPLSTVLSSAYLIEKYASGEDQGKREKHLQRIVSSVNMLTDILNDFLSVGKIEEGKIQVRLSRFNLRELVVQLTGELKSSLRKHQKIKYRHEGPTEVLMDQSLLKHIIMNLVSNASKFSAESMPVEILTVCRESQVVLSVKDYGIGISASDQKHLMNRFFRGTNAVNIQGTGLGLHIVAKYAELMNGEVQCHSELDKGSEFIITFQSKST